MTRKKLAGTALARKAPRPEDPITDEIRALAEGLGVDLSDVRTIGEARTRLVTMREEQKDDRPEDDAADSRDAASLVLLTRRQTSEREREKDPARKAKRAQRVRGVKKLDGYVVPTEYPPPKDPALTVERLDSEFWEAPTDAHWAMLEAVRSLVQMAGEPLDPASFPGLEKRFEPHRGKLPRDAIEWVRAAYVARFGWPPDLAWQSKLADAFTNALAMRAWPVSFRRSGRVLKPDGGKSAMADRADRGPGTDGLSILRWLKGASLPGSVPSALTANAIDAALQRATLAKRGGGKSRKAPWRTVLDDLIRSTGQEPFRPPSEP